MHANFYIPTCEIKIQQRYNVLHYYCPTIMAHLM